MLYHIVVAAHKGEGGGPIADSLSGESLLRYLDDEEKFVVLLGA